MTATTPTPLATLDENWTPPDAEAADARRVLDGQRASEVLATILKVCPLEWVRQAVREEPESFVVQPALVLVPDWREAMNGHTMPARMVTLTRRRRRPERVIVLLLTPDAGAKSGWRMGARY